LEQTLTGTWSPALPSKLPEAEAIIDCKDLWKVYGDTLTAQKVVADRLTKDASLAQHNAVVGVGGVSFSVRRGEIFCVMGLSGSGKSTVVRHINGLVTPTAGQILVGGRDVARMKEPELRALRAEKIGMVFQNMALLPHRTVRENVAFGLEVRRQSRASRFARAEEMLAAVQLTGWGNRYPSELSGGMQQRVGIARALAINPDILLMDEPFSALDPLIRTALQDQFLDLARGMGKTTVFITHDLSEALKMGDCVAIMRDGVIVQTGTPAELVLAPADDYVRTFTKGMSRLPFVTAGAIMRRIEPSLVAGKPMVAVTDTLDTLVDRLGEATGGLIVSDAGLPVGQIAFDDLLNEIRINR
jgi:glycine betaine/proline transport system ATP-binding protein